MDRGMHHLHMRKRIYQKYEPYPNPNKWKNLLDRMIYVIVFLGPLMTVPQILKIWAEKSAEGVSIISWASYIVIAFFWLLYGIAHKDKPIIVTNLLWIAVEVVIVIGIVIY